ncbi:DUF1501 domain-containing protein [Paenibacillus aestuarii]|uniref:DUF1501 domain-containing protein n=1 Tax=Paenibacillus aestuarii TaxID=516965 RepID=A0ABW0K2I9_9BACL|nr:DUF1501 domain-containing protein [Paenibacillus aestuarii]
MRMTRRDFLKLSAGVIATLSFGGTLLATEKGRDILRGEADFKYRRRTPVLVVVQLSGGNDGLNTVIPYGSGAYYDARPGLALQQHEVLALNETVGLHPALAHLQQYYEQGKLAIIQGAGYPQPDYSHFRSMEIWQTAKPEELHASGWLGRYIQSSLPEHQLPAVQIGGFTNKAFSAPGINVPSIESLGSFYALSSQIPANDHKRMTSALMKIYQDKPEHEWLRISATQALAAFQSMESVQSMVSAYKSGVSYPKGSLASRLQLIAKLAAAKSGTRVYYVELGGFDDHANEKEQHAGTLRELDEALHAFYTDLQAQRLHRDVVTMVFSEFGRRLKENGSGGTDHGTAAPVFVLGGEVKGGLYGEYPSLAKLIHGDLKYEVDFRSVYYTLIEDWLGGDATSTLGGSFEKLRFI